MGSPCCAKISRVIPSLKAESPTTASFEHLGLAIMAILAVLAPAFLVDDVAFFNYVNNVEGPHLLYYYTGYVHLIPELVSYLLSPLPLVAQLLLYRVPPFVAALLLYREAARLLMLRGSATEARLLALAMILVLRAFDPSLLANLSHSAWAVFLAATMLAIRINLGDGRYSGAGLAGVVVAGLAFPLGNVLGGLLAFHALTSPVRRGQNAALAATIIVGQALMSAGAPEPLWNSRLASAGYWFLASFHDTKLASLLAVLAPAVLTGAVVWARRHARRNGGLMVMGSLAYVGWTSVGAYVVSSRFDLFDGAFDERYSVPALCCALMAVGWMLLSARPEPARMRWIGAYAGAAVMLAVVVVFSARRMPLGQAMMRYDFVIGAAAARQQCRADEMWVYEDNESSPVLLCRPLVRPATNFYLRNFDPVMGSWEPDKSDPGRPFILGPKPLF